jgi:hypothetical protein
VLQDDVLARLLTFPNVLITSHQGLPDARSAQNIADDDARERPGLRGTSEFEKRHQERFKGAIFDWKDFQRDGQPFPAPEPARPRPRRRSSSSTRGGGDEGTLVDTDLRPQRRWHPDGAVARVRRGSRLARRPQVREPRPVDRHARRPGDAAHQRRLRARRPQFSPDGQYLSYTRTFGTDMIISQKLNHGGPRDLYIRPVDGGEPST